MNLRNIRQNRGLKVSDLASIMEVDSTTITRWETGTRVPDVNTALKIAEILGCTLDELLRVENPTPPLPEQEQGKLTA
ncbi:MAG: helix-turn-helix transcriptional regulator [Synergistaceae bacterium]|nr:helix-turn-helix transcriptional regulator [Synergistaceae bacterium]